MLDDRIKNMTPEEKGNLRAGLAGTLDFITLMQYTNAINDMANSAEDFRSLTNRYLYYIKDHMGDDELNKLKDLENNHGFARDCFCELSYIMHDRFKEFQDIQDIMNKLIDTVSGETAYNMYYNYATSNSFINQHVGRGPNCYSSREEYFKKFVEPGFGDINGVLCKQVLDYIQKLKSNLKSCPYIRCADETRGIYEYCQDTDYDYYFDTCSAEHIDGGSFTDFKNKYDGFEKTSETDAFIEAVLKLLPKIYLSSKNLVSMHSDPEKAQAIYDQALAKRPSTTPAVPKLTKDLLPKGTPITPKANATPAKEQPRPTHTPDGRPISPLDHDTVLGMALLFGIFGGHHFYAGKIKMGLLYLCTVGLFTIGVVVDIFKIMRGKFKDSQGKYIVDVNTLTNQQ